MPSLIGKLINATPVPMARQQSTGNYLLTDTPLAYGGVTNMRAYQTMSTVYSCVSLIANSVSRVEWHLYKKQPQDARRRYSTTDTPSDQRTEVTRHPALSLLNAPNPFFSRSRLFELDQTYLGLTGEYYWVLDRTGPGRMPVGLWSVRPDRMEPVPDPVNYLSGWIYTSPDGRTKIPLQVDEVIQVALPNPLDPYRGIGPVQSILVDIDASRYSAEWNRNFFLNSATPYGIITTPNNLDDVEFKQLMDRWRETHRGVSRSGRVGVLEGGSTFTPAGMSMKDMDFSELRNLGRDIVREAFRMHKIMLGTTDDVNRANAQTGEEVFASWIIVPELDRRRDAINSKLLPMFRDDSVEFDYVTPVPPNREEDRLQMVAKAQAAAFLQDAGYDPHDILEVVGLPDMGVAIEAVQAPVAPPHWVPETPAAPGGPSQPALPAGGQQQPSNKATLSKSSVHYRAGSPSRECGNCAMFHPDTHTCDLVMGEIEAGEVCDRWVARTQNRKDTQARVIAQLAADYPPAATAWAHHARWSGPTPMRADHLQPDMQWMDQADPHHVDDFVQRIRAGKKLKPIIAVKTPGASKPKIVDGHHRYLAAVAEGIPVRTWIATVTRNHGPWESMHDHQIDAPALASLIGTGLQLRPYTTRALTPAALNRGEHA